jgi:hypothetical protein
MDMLEIGRFHLVGAKIGGTIARPDNTYGFEEFRRDPEDAGGVDPRAVLLECELCRQRRRSHRRHWRRDLVSRETA